MQYAPYYRIVPGANTAVLFVHGIVGTPAHFKELIPIVPESWSVYNILLDGHGKEVEDFSNSLMTRWSCQVSNQVDEILQTHEKLLIVAHSMGTLFAIQESVRLPHRVKGLFLLAVPLSPQVRPDAAINSVKAALGLAKPGSAAMQIVDDSGVHLSAKLWKYASWIPRFLELLRQIARTQEKLLPRLCVPTWVFQSRRDELVRFSACKKLKNHPFVRLTILENSGHFAYSEEDLHLLQNQLRQMIQSIQ